jgi:hypothetical protein
MNNVVRVRHPVKDYICSGAGIQTFNQPGPGWASFPALSLPGSDRPGSSYQLEGPAALIAIRGAIFYAHCYEDGSQYICTCNGTLDISSEGKELREVSAFHHEPYTVLPGGEQDHMQPAEMKEHTDLEIFEFMYRIEKGSQ